MVLSFMLVPKMEYTYIWARLNIYTVLERRTRGSGCATARAMSAASSTGAVLQCPIP